MGTANDNDRQSGQDARRTSAGQSRRGRDHLKIALLAFALCAVLALAAYAVGWFGAVVLGLGAVVSGLFGSVHLVRAIKGGRPD